MRAFEKWWGTQCPPEDPCNKPIAKNAWKESRREVLELVLDQCHHYQCQNVTNFILRELAGDQNVTTR